MASLFDSLTEDEIDALLRQLNESEGANPEPNPLDYASEADVTSDADYSTEGDSSEPIVADYASEADVSPESDYSTVGDTPILQAPDMLPPMEEIGSPQLTGEQDVAFTTPFTAQANIPEMIQPEIVPSFGGIDELEALRSAAAVPQTISNVFNTSELIPTLRGVQEVGGGTQYIPEYRPPDYEIIGTDGGLFGGGLGQPTGNLADVLRTDIEYAPGYYPGQGIVVDKDAADRLGLGGNIFLSNPNWGGLTAPVSTVSKGPAANELTGAVPGISPGTGVGDQSPTLSAPAVNTGGTPRTVVFDDIVRGEIEKEIAAMRSAGISNDRPEWEARIEAAANRGIEIYDIETNKEYEPPPSPRTGAGQSGIPLIIPIPGLDPATAAILTAAGLIFSGGKIARLNPQNPVGSVAGAVQGIGQTGQNVIDVATGQTSLGEIWDPGSTGAPSGGTGGGAAAGTGQQTTGTGVIGAIGGIFGGGTSGAGGTTGGQQTTGTGTVGVTPGALGGDTTQAPSTTQQPIRQTGTAQQPEMATSTSVPGLFGGGQTIQPAVPQQPQAAPIRQTGTAQGPDIATSSSVPGLFGGGQTIEPATPRQGPLTPIRQTGTATGPNIVSQTPSVDLEPDVTSGPPAVTPTPSSTVPTSTTPTTSGTAATPIVINAPTVGYTLPQAGTPAARNLYTEAGTTLSSLASPMQRFQIGIDASGNAIYGTIPQTGGRPSTLSEAIAQGYGGLAGGMREADVQNLFGAIGAATGRTPTAQGGYQAELNRAAAEQTAAANAALRLGNIMDAELLAGRAQALRQQANPELFGASGALPQYTAQAREQAMRDVAALRAAEAGQLTPEQIRNAQQAAREAYGARGQVFSQGAAAQEVLNRQQMIQQQQQIARQNLAQSMGQLGQGVAYQTANIFDPMAATLGGQYGMQSQNVGMNQALYNQAMGLTSGAGGYGFAQQMINPFTGYAQDVYGTNVNALNAAQIAAANRQAALEAAKMGQTGTYAQALGNLIASGGLGQIQSGITGGVQGLLNLLGGKWPTS